MADPHELPRNVGPRLPSEENRESEVDPNAFRKVLKVDESDESQKRNKRQRAEEELEAEDEVKEGNEDVENNPPTTSFSSFMGDDEDSDSVFNVGEAKGGVKRAKGAPPEETQSYSGPQSSYSGRFMGKDQGEEVGDALFENLDQAAPPEEDLFAPPEEEPISQPQQPRSTTSTTQSAPDTSVDEPQESKAKKPQESQETQTDKHKEKHKEKEKEKTAKKLEPLDLEAKNKVEDPQNVKKIGEEVHEITGEKIEEPKQTQKVGKADPKDIEAPHEKKVEATGIQSDTADPHDQHPDDNDDEKKKKHELHLEGHEKKEGEKNEKEAAPGFKEVKKEVDEKKKPTDQVAAAAYEEYGTHTTGPTSLVGNEPKVDKTTEGKGSKKVVKQPDTPVIFGHEGKVETKHDTNDDKQDQQQQQGNQVAEIQGGTTQVQGTDAPAYSKLNPDVFELFEKMVGLLTIEHGKGVSTTEVKLSLPGSIFDKTKIVMQRFESAPGTFNLQLQGSEQAVNMFSANMGQLASAFAGSKLAFEVNLRAPELLKEERTVLHRKSEDHSKGEQNKEGN